jgi:hypothetical protein
MNASELIRARMGIHTCDASGTAIYVSCIMTPHDPMQIWRQWGGKKPHDLSVLRTAPPTEGHISRCAGLGQSVNRHAWPRSGHR